MPRHIQYQAQGLRLPFSSQETAFFMTKNPSKKATRNAVIRFVIGKEVLAGALRLTLANSHRFPAKIVGMDRRKENRTASLMSHPNILAQEIVDALLEMPGISAADCRVPIINMSRIFQKKPVFSDLAIA